jgi:hypothetical protein
MTQEQKGNTPATGSGSKLLTHFDNTDNVLTDASPTRELGPFSTRGIESILADLTTNKGCDLKFVPMSNLDDDGVPQREGKASTVASIAAGGGSELVSYSKIKSPFIKLVITKTEAGDMDVYYGEISGGL